MLEKTQNLSHQPWHTLTIGEVAELLQTSSGGLDLQGVQERLEQYGRNTIYRAKRTSPWKRFFLQFHNVLIYVLLASAGITSLLQHWVDTSVILGVVVINAVIGFLQEGKAERSLEAIRDILSVNATVIRDHRIQSVVAEDLVPGDIVLLYPGDKVAADLRLIDSKELRIDESILTGESVPVSKSPEALTGDLPLGDRINMAYSGTFVTYGQGRGIVIQTGIHSEIGRISARLEDIQTLTTPLLRKMASLSRWLTVVIVVIAVFVFFFGVYFYHFPGTDMFMAAVGLAVAAIPEGLPAIMTITLAIGVQRMARRNAIIRRLPAVETLGAVTVICTDKTGTLTRNEMTVTTIVTGDGHFEVTGTGYQPIGDVFHEGERVDVSQYDSLPLMIRVGVLCNEASLHEDNEQWQAHGDPTEVALLTLGLKVGMDQLAEQGRRPRLDMIPFESKHRFMATLHQNGQDHVFIYVKGAPERILAMCSHVWKAGESLPIDETEWVTVMEDMGHHGQRMLALAFKPGDPGSRQLSFEDFNGGFTLLGIVGIIDPPREEAIRAVQQCQTAGIRIKMITGDYGPTAIAIAEQMGIGDGQSSLTGSEIERMSLEELRGQLPHIDVFARASPEQKLKLVMALQENGEVTAMTGDGVNDAPALKRADIGIAMGKKGTEVAKESAEMVLTDDDFASIAAAVEEGRTVYNNLRKALLFILPTNGGEALIVMAAIIAGTRLPITPLQILWVNMVTTVTLALTLAFESAETTVMMRPPRPPKESLIGRWMLWRIGFVSFVILAGTFGLFVMEQAQGFSIATARTIAVNTLVFFEIFYLFNTRYVEPHLLSFRNFLGNPYALISSGILILLQLGFTYWEPMQYLFDTKSLNFRSWVFILITSVTLYILVELEKFLVRFPAHKSSTWGIFQRRSS